MVSMARAECEMAPQPHLGGHPDRFHDLLFAYPLQPRPLGVTADAIGALRHMRYGDRDEFLCPGRQRAIGKNVLAERLKGGHDIRRELAAFLRYDPALFGSNGNGCSKSFPRSILVSLCIGHPRIFVSKRSRFHHKEQHEIIQTTVDRFALMVERLSGVLGTVGHHLISHAPSHSTASLSLAFCVDSGCHRSFQDIRNRASIPNEFASGGGQRRDWGLLGFVW